jgi:hypothetical protein
MQAINRASALPAMFERDVQSIKATMYVETPFRPVFNYADAVISGIPLSSAPVLLGYNLVTPKQGSVVPMHVPGNGDTLLAYWRYGMGHAFAFTSDDRPHWASRWLGWPGYPHFWAQLVRWSLNNEQNGEIQSAVENVDGRGHVVVDALTPGGDYIEGAHLNAAIAGPDGQTSIIALPQTAPGRYEATFDASETGLYMVNVRDLDHRGIGQSIGLATPYSPEYRNIPPNTALLSDLSHATGGRYLESPEQVFHNTRLWNVGVDDLAPGCLVLAALLLLVDIAWRRMAWKMKRPKFMDGRPADLPEAPAVERQTSFGVITIPKRRESNELQPGYQAEEYLSRPASTRIGDDDDDPFPYVASKDKLKR